jgi:hypothetical protein
MMQWDAAPVSNVLPPVQHAPLYSRHEQGGFDTAEEGSTFDSPEVRGLVIAGRREELAG